ncbi:MAG: tRNA lysidine(34) synthetase TilS [Chloroflexi bacterium]|jgi:tRNA(Ile)-lysidine synthase|nr:tRNA lysidine(34) synthetase TilS [Chloroflexota bacterium]
MIAKQLPHRVERFITEHSLIGKRDLLLVGVSGGVDSVCLLHILITLKDRLKIDLHVAHLNHQLRNVESDADAEYVFRLARRLGIDATIDRRDVQEYQALNRCSLEEAAREVRYAFFSEVAESIGTRTVAVAHTANDQAETILMHLIRGTGLSGLRGMRTLSRWNMPETKPLTIIRPLLEISRHETESYCTAHALDPRYDSSNLSLQFLRNRVRAEIMPQLLEYNPNVVESLSRTARIIADDISYLDDETARISESVIEEIPHGLAIDNKAFSAVPPAIKRHLLRSSLRNLLGSLRDIESIHIENVIDILDQPAGKELSLPYGLTFFGDYEKSIISRGENPLSLLPIIEEGHSLNIPGQTAFTGWQVKAEIIEGNAGIATENDFTAHLDLDAVGTDLTVRGRKDGDRFQPLGMSDTKKLQDFMVDSKIPRAWRDRVPLVCEGEQIIWVVGWRIDHRVRVTDATRRILRLEFEME